MNTLIVFSHLRWNFVFQRPQHLLTRLSRHHRVVFVEEPVHGPGEPSLECTTVNENIEVLRPRTTVAEPGFSDDQLKQLAPLLVRWLDERRLSEDLLAWFYTPMALPILQVLRPRGIVYDCMDELAAFKDAANEMTSREAALLRVADIVLTGGPSLYAAKRGLHPNVHCLPSAVDAEHFRPSRPAVPTPEQEHAARLQGFMPSPRLGFFGVIDERLDLSLIEHLARDRASWQFVFVGPVVKIDARKLPRHNNLHWLGPQSYAQLPALVAGWDVCLLPFALNAHTRFISPTKTLEYLAAEKPCVSTPVRDVVDMYGDVVAIASNAHEFLKHCDAALSESSRHREGRVEASRQRVALYSWDQTASKIETLLAGISDRSQLERVVRRAHPTAALP